MNTVQQVYTGSAALPVTPVSGTFTLALDGQTTGPLAHDASAGTVQAALESLSTIGVGNVTVTSQSYGYQVEFVGTLSNTDVTLMTASSSLQQAAGSIGVINTQDGIPDGSNATNINSSFVDGDASTLAVQTLTFSPLPNQGSWSIDGGASIFYNGTPSGSGWSASGSAASGTVVLTWNMVGSQSPVSPSNIDLAQSITGQPEIYTVTVPADATDGAVLLTLDLSNFISADIAAPPIWRHTIGAVLWRRTCGR